MELKLNREVFTERSIIGTLMVNDEFECYTLELPWRDNLEYISCIPKGRYKIVLELSNHFKRVLPELKGVPNREEIKIHIANWPHELKGCIAVGKSTGTDYLNRSGETFRSLFPKIARAVNDGEEVWITVS